MRSSNLHRQSSVVRGPLSVADNAGRIAACGFADATASASRSRTRQTPVDFPRRTRTINTLATDNGQLTTGKPAKRRAFTLIEIMVVVVIILLMLGMAVPVFRVINGSRSEAGAANVISAMLNRARTDAIGIQQPYGVAFVYNPVTQGCDMAEVYVPPVQVWTASGQTFLPQAYISTTIAGVTYYFFNPSTNSSVTASTGPQAAAPTGLVSVYGPPIDTVPDTDLIPLPIGIGVQTICNCTFTSTTTRGSNGYLAVGAIMFDAKGRIISLPYGIAQTGKLGVAASLAYSYPNSGSSNSVGVASQFGLVVYQNEAYQSHRSSQQPEAVYTDAPQSTGTALPSYSIGSPTQLQADLWLDQNATPLLIDRYTGTLIKAE